MKVEHCDWSKGSAYDMTRYVASITFLSLVTKLATFAILSRKHHRQLLHEIWIYSKDITRGPQKYGLVYPKQPSP